MWPGLGVHLGFIHSAVGGGSSRDSSLTSCECALHIVYDLVIVADDVVAMDDDRHFLPQVEPHEPRLLVLTLWEAHVPLLTHQSLLRNHQTHLGRGRVGSMWDHRSGTGRGCLIGPFWRLQGGEHSGTFPGLERI